MKGYQIGTVCELLDVKPHVLRYWEQEIPILAPRKDEGGRRVYSRRDLDLLMRIKYLLQEKKFTLAGVREKLWQEYYSEDHNIKAHITALRKELLFLQHRVGEQRKKLNRFSDEL
ncbi:MAG TPA: MerR family transcriptional regulator [Sediminispirochaeta sp.]|nr:MerR family transcriptional regulator [Sediminispirochaeta sp.]